VFKEVPEVLFTGLNKPIGKPRDLEKNTEDTSYFNNQGIDLTIPHRETEQYPKVEEAPMEDIENVMKQANVRSTMLNRLRAPQSQLFQQSPVLTIVLRK